MEIGYFRTLKDPNRPVASNNHYQVSEARHSIVCETLEYHYKCFETRMLSNVLIRIETLLDVLWNVSKSRLHIFWKTVYYEVSLLGWVTTISEILLSFWTKISRLWYLFPSINMSFNLVLNKMSTLVVIFTRTNWRKKAFTPSYLFLKWFIIVQGQSLQIITK